MKKQYKGKAKTWTEPAKVNNTLIIEKKTKEEQILDQPATLHTSVSTTLGMWKKATKLTSSLY